MIELPQEVKLQILIDDLNIRCCNLQRETRFNENITIDRRGELLNNLNEYWYSQFELIKIEEPNTNKVLLTLDENKELTIDIKKADEVEVIYMLMAGLIRVCKEVEADQELMIETIKELWGSVE